MQLINVSTMSNKQPSTEQHLHVVGPYTVSILNDFIKSSAISAPIDTSSTMHVSATLISSHDIHEIGRLTCSLSGVHV